MKAQPWGRVEIATAPENPYNSSSLLRNHQVCNTIRAEPSIKSTKFESRRVPSVVIYLLRLAYLAWGSISPGLAEDLQVACETVAGQRRALADEMLGDQW